MSSIFGLRLSRVTLVVGFGVTLVVVLYFGTDKVFFDLSSVDSLKKASLMKFVPKNAIKLCLSQGLRLSSIFGLRLSSGLRLWAQQLV